MTVVPKILLVAMLLALAACGTGKGPVSQAASDWNLSEVSVEFGPDIPPDATGDDFDSNFVWTGSDSRDRQQQVLDLFRRAMREVGSETMRGTRKVNLLVTVNRFHTLTETSRLFCCGDHNIHADLAIVDAASGAELASADNLYMGRVALGGIPGLVAVAVGRDQTVRILEALVYRTRAWLAGL